MNTDGLERVFGGGDLGGKAMKFVSVCGCLRSQLPDEWEMAPMSAMIDEDVAETGRVGLAGGFADGPPGGGHGDPAETWRRLWFTLLALIVYRIGTYLPIPGVDPLALVDFLRTSPSGVLGVLELFAGSAAHDEVSVLALGILPCISAFVIVELASRIVPRLGSMAAGGSTGRRRLNQYARILAVALAALQAFGVAFGLEGMFGVVPAPGLLFEATIVVTLVAGAIFVMWLAEQITVRGMGNGALVVLVCGIVSHLPFALSTLMESVKTGDLDSHWLLVMLLMTAAVVALVVVVERATRWITIYDPRGAIGARAPDSRYANIALKLNPTQVWAPIATGILAIPLSQTIGSAGGRDSFLHGSFMIGGGGYFSLYGLLIALFAVLFGLVTFDPAQIARTLKDSGGFVPGYRPGENTARHLRKIQTTLAVIGAAYLVAVCVLPDVIYRWAAVWPPFVGYQLFLLTWLMVHILDQMRPYVRR
ncbi:MAG TPA: preprotein translocase subunit SecY [Candidatus Angelobacter sp.]|nr:preprotein translocase subunit SecY [Candidatus Angelobacter sp.]